MIICSGTSYSAEEAHSLGMVERLVQAGGAMDAARALAAEISLGGPVAVAAAIHAIRRIPGSTSQEASEMETDAGIEAVTSGEPMEGILSFAERRPPRW